ncbi:MAG: polysaccharide biosynthesis/export family protein [Beijerinckiaceae bacterium]
MTGLAFLTGCGNSSGDAFNFSDAPKGSGATVGGAALSTGKFRALGTVSSNQDAYKVGAGDRLTIEVFQVDEMKREVIVNDDGTITMPLVGRLSVADNSTQQIERKLAAKLSDYLRTPEVTVGVKEFNSQKFTVEGAVNAAGVFPIQGQTSLLQAIATAKGLNNLADPSTVLLFRESAGRRYAAKFDLQRIRAGREPDPVLRSRDVVVVEESGSKRFLENAKPFLVPATTLLRLGVVGY